ncbi:hypothetical protein ACJX0J_036161 [Zea mays]
MMMDVVLFYENNPILEPILDEYDDDDYDWDAPGSFLIEELQMGKLDVTAFKRNLGLGKNSRCKKPLSQLDEEEDTNCYNYFGSNLPKILIFVVAFVDDMCLKIIYFGIWTQGGSWFGANHFHYLGYKFRTNLGEFLCFSRFRTYTGIGFRIISYTRYGLTFIMGILNFYFHVLVLLYDILCDFAYQNICEYICEFRLGLQSMVLKLSC